jgi:dTDP-4-dehydrorhamnose reductase
MTQSGQTSWHGFARRILEETGAAGRVTLVPITTEERGGGALRPRWSVLSSAKLQREYGVEPVPHERELADLLRAGAPLAEGFSTRGSGP